MLHPKTNMSKKEALKELANNVSESIISLDYMFPDSFWEYINKMKAKENYNDK